MKRKLFSLCILMVWMVECVCVCVCVCVSDDSDGERRPKPFRLIKMINSAAPQSPASDFSHRFKSHNTHTHTHTHTHTRGNDPWLLSACTPAVFYVYLRGPVGEVGPTDMFIVALGSGATEGHRCRVLHEERFTVWSPWRGGTEGGDGGTEGGCAQ